MKKLKKIGLVLLCVILLFTLAIIILSPFGSKAGFEYKLVVHTVEINAPVDSVYSFLGKSGNARKWSVFVNHIVPINADRVSDGKVGSQRRCFQNEDEKGLQWDEEITVATTNQRRQLIIFNMVDFPITAKGLATEQIYESLTPTKTKLSFTLFYLNHAPSFADLLKTYYAGFKVKDIYERNMANIKRIVETGN